jgi:hypothetical protein
VRSEWPDQIEPTGPLRQAGYPSKSTERDASPLAPGVLTHANRRNASATTPDHSCSEQANVQQLPPAWRWAALPAHQAARPRPPRRPLAPCLAPRDGV